MKARPYRRNTPEFVATIRTMAAQGMTRQEVTKATGAASRTIRDLTLLHDIQWQSKGGRDHYERTDCSAVPANAALIAAQDLANEIRLAKAEAATASLY